MLKIFVSTVTGVSNNIHDVAAEMIRLANTLNVSVEMHAFNGTRIIAQPGDKVTKVVSRWKDESNVQAERKLNRSNR